MIFPSKKILQEGLKKGGANNALFWVIVAGVGVTVGWGVLPITNRAFRQANTCLLGINPS